MTASFDELLWISVCLGLALLPGITVLPPWVILTVLAVGTLRLGLRYLDRDIPPGWLRAGLAVVTIGVLFQQFKTFNGLLPGSALLSLIGGLKLLETRTLRDVRVVTLIIYFLSLANLLEGESIWLLLYLVALCWVTTAGLGSAGDAARSARWRANLRDTGRLMVHAIPVALGLWLFFPRLGGPLWEIPPSGDAATSGLSDRMSPGDITALALSDEVAFRVRFMSAAPPPADLYWRGPVLHDFDGRTWSRGALGAQSAPHLEFTGPAYRYSVSLEPSPHNWLFLLDHPASWNDTHASLTGDYMVVSSSTLFEPLDVDAESYVEARDTLPLTAVMRALDTQLPSGPNPRAARLAQDLWRLHPDTTGYVQAILDMFREQPFFYTLEPPRLADDSVDAFLFTARRGFCAHYASAMAVLLRAAHIPARVVTGYAGGTLNRFAGYWLVRQSQAHAWDEVWFEGRGWVRVDPTASIAPERVERDAGEATDPGGPRGGHWRLRAGWWLDARLRMDAVRLLWREWVLEYDQGSQERLLAWLHVPAPDGQQLAVALALCLITGMSWLTWQIGRDLSSRPADPVERAYRIMCRRLARVGLERRPHEGAEDFALRVAQSRPDLSVPVAALSRQYTTLRYGVARPAGAAEFGRAVRRFKPQGSRAS